MAELTGSDTRDTCEEMRTSPWPRCSFVMRHGRIDERQARAIELKENDY
jgi:hypothetical protein